MNIKMLKPPIKWLGGKTKIVDKIISRFPKKFANYHEIFLGGGSVLLALLNEIIEGKIVVKNDIYAYDINDKLIEMWQNIKNNPESLYVETQKHVDLYNSCGMEKINRNASNLEDALSSQESYYYYIRSKYNKHFNNDEYNSIKRSAMFIFLNKTGFRGMYRTGPNGFNVPFGNYKSPEIINETHIKLLSELIADVNFIHLDFRNSLKLPKYKDFVYLDPPYLPISKTSSFVGYVSDGFGEQQHEKLFNLCLRLFDKSINFLMSNSDSLIICKYFDPETFTIDKIKCKRTINSKNPGSSVNEVLISW